MDKEYITGHCPLDEWLPALLSVPPAQAVEQLEMLARACRKLALKIEQNDPYLHTDRLAYREVARDQYADDDTQIDEDALISQDKVTSGGWVQAWVRLDDFDVETKDPKGNGG